MEKKKTLSLLLLLSPWGHYILYLIVLFFFSIRCLREVDIVQMAVHSLHSTLKGLTETIIWEDAPARRLSGCVTSACSVLHIDCGQSCMKALNR